MRTPARLCMVALAASMFAAGCDDPTVPVVPEGPEVTERPGNPLLGLLAFKRECSSCHASDDGFDLAFFSFPDSTVIRRAVGHVDTTTAHDIVAYIRTLTVEPVDRFARMFQPGSVRLDDDVTFATELFGSDAWPSDLTSSALAAIDPTKVPVALSFPRWSFEESNLDWMPDEPFPKALLDAYDGRGEAALAAYRAVGSDERLLDAVLALRIAERDPKKTAAPCLTNDPVRFRPTECFEARRWISTIVAQHMLRTGRSEPIHAGLHDAWWDVGFAARRSVVDGVPIENAVENWAVWMYLGWAFAPERHASVYLAGGLQRMGLPRHATFHALRAQVVRPPARGDVYKDLATAVRFAPQHWLLDVARFGYGELIDRLEGGDLPDNRPFRTANEGMPESQLTLAWEGFSQASSTLWRRLSPDQLDTLRPLHERVVALLPTGQ